MALTLLEIRDDIADALDHADRDRSDYCTDVALEKLERWQEGIAAAEVRLAQLETALRHARPGRSC